MEKNWLSVHIYLNGQFESFLNNINNQFIGPLYESKIINSFFFIRYYDTGLHIRLRLQSNEENFQEKIKPAVIKFLDAISVKQKRRKSQDFTLLSYAFVDYEPEIERYGGIEGIATAENHFYVSSLMVLKHIKASDRQWNYDQAIGAALQLHLTFIFSLSLLPETIGLLLEHIYQDWLPAALNYPTKLNKENRPYEKNILEEAFEKSYINQKIQLINIVKKISNNFNKGTSAWVGTWKRHIIETHQTIIALAETKDCDIVAMRIESEIFAINIYKSYIHMTNNRLGLRNMDEAFIGYLIKRILQDMHYIIPKANELSKSNLINR